MEEFLQRLIELRGKEELSEDEQNELDRLERKLKEAAEDDDEQRNGITEEDIDNIAERLIEATSSEEDIDEEERDIHNPDETEIEVGEPRTPDWMKRVVKWVNGGIKQARDEPDEAKAIYRDLRKDVKEMGNKQRAHENKLVKDKAEEAQDRAGEFIDCTPSYRKQIKRMAKMSYIRTLGIGTTSEGQTLLPKPFLAEIAVIIEERGVARNLFRGIPMTSDSLDLDKIATKPSAGWVDEKGLISQSDPAFGEGSLDAKKLGAITSWSMELQEDSAYAFIPVIAELFAEAILEKEDDAGFVGDGTSTHGGFTGILELSGASTVTLATGSTTDADADLDNFRALRDELSLAKRRGAVYVVHPDIESNLEGEKTSDGEYIYRRPADQSAPGTLWGHPVVLTESMPSSAAAGEKFVAFGNPVYMLMGMRRGLRATQSTDGVLSNASNEVTFNAFQQDGVLWKTTERIAFQAQLEDAFANLQTAAS